MTGVEVLAPTADPCRVTALATVAGDSHRTGSRAPCVEMGGRPVLSYKMGEEMPDTLRMTSGNKNVCPSPF